MTEYGITKNSRLIRIGLSFEQAKSFIKAKEDARDRGEYKIVSRVIGEWVE